MIVLSDYREKGTNNSIWSLFDGTIYAEYEPEEMPEAIQCIINRTKAAETVFVTNLSMYCFDIIKTLWTIGFNPIKKNPSVKDMHEWDMKYLINGDMNCYNIVIKHNKRAVTFINYDNIVNLNDRDEIIKTWSFDFDGEKPRRYAISIYRSIGGLNTDCGIIKNFPTTISGYSRRRWKDKLGFFNAKKLLPDANKIKLGGETLEEYCRPAYHGGLNIARGKALTADMIDLPGYVLDANSLYPYIMRYYPLPKGQPKYVKGKPDEKTIKDVEKGYNYMYLRVKVSFDLKPDGVPCICMHSKNKDFFLHKRGWLETSKIYNYFEQKYVEDDPENPTMIELTLTYTDYKLMLENYNINKIEYIDHLVFFVSRTIFAEYVDEYFEKKQNAKSPAEKRIAKMMLNALSGNMARLPQYTNTIIMIDKKGKITTEEEHSAGGESFIYVGAAITSYAREYLIRHAKRCGSIWLYSDTDSVHLIGENIPKHFKIGDGLGEWKIEKEWDKVTYYKLKMYGMIKNGKVKYTLAGVPKDNIKMLERMTEDTNNYSLDGLDAIDPEVEATFSGDYEEAANPEQVKMDNLKRDFKEYGLKAIHYASFPTTIVKHDRTEFSQRLLTQWTSLDDRCFWSK